MRLHPSGEMNSHLSGILGFIYQLPPPPPPKPPPENPPPLEKPLPPGVEAIAEDKEPEKLLISEAKTWALNVLVPTYQAGTGGSSPKSLKAWENFFVRPKTIA